MKQISKILLIVSIFIISILSFLNLNERHAFANTNTSIYFKCDKPNIFVGDTFTITVASKNVANLYGASVDLNYDPTIVEVLKVSNLEHFSKALDTQIVKNDLSNGLLSFYTTFTGDKSGFTSLNTNLFQITFKAKKDGSFFFNSNKKLEQNSIVLKLADNNANSIPFTASNFFANITKRSSIESVTSNTIDNTAVVNNDIILNTKAKSSFPLKYKYWVKKDDNDWKILSDYSSNSTTIWRPTESGNYLISSYIKSKDSPLDPDDSKIMKIKILDNKILTDIKLNNSIIHPNEKLNVQAISNSPDTLYKFWINDGSDWHVIKDYSENNKISINIPKIGSYKISVYAKSKYSLSDCDDVMITDISVLPNISLNSSSKSAFVNGEKVKLTANTDFPGNYEYKFWALEDNQWKVIQDYSSDNIAYFTPKKIGKIKLSVYVREKGNKNIIMNMTEVNVLETSVDKVQSNLDTISKPGDIVNLKVNSNNPNAVFKFWVLENNQWKVIKDYSSDKSVSYKIPSIGDYKFSIYVKDKNSTLACDNVKILDLNVPLSVNLTSSSKAAYINGDKVKLTAQTNTHGNYEYKFWALENNQWKVIQDYSSNNIAYFSPKSIGKTKLSVYVREKGKEDIIMNMSEVNVLETSVDIVQSNLDTISKPGDTVNLKVNSNNPNAIFKFWVLENNQWKVIKDYSSDKSVSYKIPSTGDYKFSIYVKDKNSSSTCDNMKILDLNVPLSVKLTSSTNSIHINDEKVKLTAQTNTHGNFEYKFWALENNQWKVIQDYSSNNIAYFLPKNIGKIKLSVYVREKNKEDIIMDMTEIDVKSP